jgi:hypothetical protein
LPLYLSLHMLETITIAITYTIIIRRLGGFAFIKWQGKDMGASSNENKEWLGLLYLFLFYNLLYKEPIISQWIKTKNDLILLEYITCCKFQSATFTESERKVLKKRFLPFLHFCVLAIHAIFLGPAFSLLVCGLLGHEQESSYDFVAIGKLCQLWRHLHVFSNPISLLWSSVFRIIRNVRTSWKEIEKTTYNVVFTVGVSGEFSDCITVHQRLNMEVDLQGLFGLHDTWCAQLHSLAETPQLPSSPAFGLV